MTPAVIRIASRADGSHVPVAVFIVNNRPETRERIRPHVKVDSSHHAAVRRGGSAARSDALHRVRDTRYGRPDSSFQSHDVKQPYSTQRRGAAPQVMASACSAVGSQDDAANSMNCGSISGCVGAISVRMMLPSLRMKNSIGFQTPPFQAIVTRSR